MAAPSSTTILMAKAGHVRTTGPQPSKTAPGDHVLLPQ
jgi:hypothetical protein